MKNAGPAGHDDVVRRGRFGLPFLPRPNFLRPNFPKPNFPGPSWPCCSVSGERCPADLKMPREIRSTRKRCRRPEVRPDRQACPNGSGVWRSARRQGTCLGAQQTFPRSGWRRFDQPNCRTFGERSMEAMGTPAKMKTKERSAEMTWRWKVWCLLDAPAVRHRAVQFFN